MNAFFTRLAMLVMFLLAVTCTWVAATVVFSISLWNILLVILAAFFLLRAFDLADKINKLGPYAEVTKEDEPTEQSIDGCQDINNPQDEDNLLDISSREE